MLKGKRLLQKMWDVSLKVLLKVLKEITKKAKCDIARPDPQLPYSLQRDVLRFGLRAKK